jgi:hypothetical protein
VKVEITPELEAALRRRGVILSVCAWCHEWLGQKDGLGAEGGVSGGCCDACLARMDRLDEDDERGETFAHGVIITVTLVVTFVAFGLLAAYAWARAVGAL